MSVKEKNLGAGQAPDVCWAKDRWLAAHPVGNDGPIVVEQWSADGQQLGVVEYADGWGYPIIQWPWLFYKANEANGWCGILHDLETSDRFVVDPAHGNHPVMLGHGWALWQPDAQFTVVRRPLATFGTAAAQPAGQGAPDGIAWANADGTPTLMKDVFVSVPGMTRPQRAGDALVGENPTNGVLVRMQSGKTGVLAPGGDCKEPRVAQGPNGQYAVVAWGDQGIRLLLFTEADLGDVEIPPETPEPGEVPAIAPFLFPIWSAPYYSHSERYGDTPLEQHVGHAILLTEQEGEPARLPREIAKYTALGLPMIVQGMNPSAEGALNLTMAWWAGGVLGPRGDHVPLDEQVRRCLERPEKPVLAYLDAGEWPATRPDWVTDRVWPTVRCYRDPDEPLATFRSRVERDLDRVAGYGVAIGLELAFYTRNGKLPLAQLLECVPLYVEWLQRYPVAVYTLFADRRPTGMLEHPILRQWAMALHRANAVRPNRYAYWDPADGDAALRNQLGQTHDHLGGVRPHFTAKGKARLLALLDGEDEGGGGGGGGGEKVYRDYGPHFERRWNELRVSERSRAIAQREGIPNAEVFETMNKPEHPNYEPDRYNRIVTECKAIQCPAMLQIAGELHHLQGHQDVGLNVKEGGNRWEDPRLTKPVATDILAIRPTDASGHVVDGIEHIVDVMVSVGSPFTTATWHDLGDNPNQGRPYIAPPKP